jgi:nucleotide-binding universal stress UspA family protein
MAFPFKKILAPVDFDESSLKALELAGQIAKQNDGEIFVVHIVPVDMDVSGMPQYVDLIKRQEGLDRDRLVAIAKERLFDVKWDIIDEMGDPADVIDQVAKRVSADLIVMVTHGRRGLARLIEGSISERVLRRAPCPVLAIRHD